jgi:hypothetical protein
MKALPWGLFVYFMASGHVNRANRAIGYSVVQIRTDLLGNLVIQTTPPKIASLCCSSFGRVT